MGALVSSRMTSMTRRMDASARSSPVRPSSRRRMTPPMESPRSAQASSSWAPSSKSSAAVTPGATAEPGTEMKVAKLTSRMRRIMGSTEASGDPSVSKTE